MGLSPGERRRIYAGDVLTVTASALGDLIAHARHMVANGFFGTRPEVAHRELRAQEYRDRVVALRKGFDADTAVRHVVEKLIREWGADPADAYFDTLKLRIVPPDGAWTDHAPAYPLAPLPAHRDTWGSNVMQQINVWAPLSPLAKSRTMGLWSQAFDAAVENDSVAWDLDELRDRRKRGDDGSYPMMPTASSPPPRNRFLPLMPGVGEASIFSGAHLHASVPNRSTLARLNIEFRIVFLADRNAGRGAPNVDGRAPRTPLHWFKSLDGGRTLADARPPLALA